MGSFSDEFERRALSLLDLYPEVRSATIPLCHLAQEQDGYLSESAMEHIANLVGSSPAEVLGTASFYDMLHTEPVGKFLVGICTNIACLLQGAEELLEHAETSLGIRVGMTSPDGVLTLEEVECVASCDIAPCAQVNYRYFGPLNPESFDLLIANLRDGTLDDSVPPHGTLSKVQRDTPALIPLGEIHAMRAKEDTEKSERTAEGSSGEKA